MTGTIYKTQTLLSFVKAFFFIAMFTRRSIVYEELRSQSLAHHYTVEASDVPRESPLPMTRPDIQISELLRVGKLE